MLTCLGPGRRERPTLLPPGAPARRGWPWGLGRSVRVRAGIERKVSSGPPPVAGALSNLV